MCISNQNNAYYGLAFVHKICDTNREQINTSTQRSLEMIVLRSSEYLLGILL